MGNNSLDDHRHRQRFMKLNLNESPETVDMIRSIN